VHYIALSENARDNAVLIHYGGSAHAAIHHGFDGVRNSGSERNGGRISSAVIQYAHIYHVDQRVPLKRCS
jgi:hypothetical protein